jgi:copper chaperone CopZ
MEKQIVIDILDTGEIRIETIGFKGAECLKESEFIEEALGKVYGRKLTKAFYMKEGTKVTTHKQLCG